MTVHVLLCIDFEQEMCGRHPTRFASPDGGSDPIVSEPTDGPIRTQWIRNPIWSGPTHGRGVAGRYEEEEEEEEMERKQERKKIIHRWNFMTYMVKLY